MAERRARRVVLLTLGLLAAITVAGLAVAQDQETLKLRSSRSAEDPRSAEYLAALVGADLTHGNGHQVLTNGDQIFPAMLDAIDHARRRISLETYVYEEGKVAEAFTRALGDAARRGIQVSIVVDRFVAAGMANADVERLRAAGCRLVTLNTPRWYALEDVNYRTHGKILVVGGHIGCTGGVGVADFWLGNGQAKDSWPDTHVRVHGTVVRSLEAAFYENFAEAGGTVTPALDDEQVEEGADAPSIALWSAPTGGSNAMKRLYLFAIAMARRSIDVASPYFHHRRVHDVGGRGRDRPRCEDSGPDRERPHGCQAGQVRVAGRIRAAAVAGRRALRVLADDDARQGDDRRQRLEHVRIGNFDNRWLELNDELNIAVQSGELAARFRADFEHDLRRSRRLDLDKWRRRPFLEKARERFWSYFGEVF